MQWVSQALIVYFIMTESLNRTSGVESLSNVEKMLRKADGLGFGELKAEVIIGVLGGIELAGVFAPVALYFPKYYIVLLLRLILTKPLFTFRADVFEKSSEKEKIDLLDEIYKWIINMYDMNKLILLSQFCVLFDLCWASISPKKPIETARVYRITIREEDY